MTIRRDTDRISVLEAQTQEMRNMLQLLLQRKETLGPTKFLNAKALHAIATGAEGECEIVSFSGREGSDLADYVETAKTVTARNWSCSEIAADSFVYLIERPWGQWEVIQHCGGDNILLADCSIDEDLTTSMETIGGRVELPLMGSLISQDQVTLLNLADSLTGPGAYSFHGEAGAMCRAAGPVEGISSSGTLTLAILNMNCPI